MRAKIESFQSRDAWASACAERLIDLALAEDLGEIGDITAQATIPAGARGRATFVARAPGVICGRPIVDQLASRFGLDIGWSPAHLVVDTGASLGVVSGPMREILAFERTASIADDGAAW